MSAETTGWQPIDTLYDWLVNLNDNDACYEVSEFRGGKLMWTMAASVRHTSPHYPNPPTHWRPIRAQAAYQPAAGEVTR